MGLTSGRLTGGSWGDALRLLTYGGIPKLFDLGVEGVFCVGAGKH